MRDGVGCGVVVARGYQTFRPPHILLLLLVSYDHDDGAKKANARRLGGARGTTIEQ